VSVGKSAESNKENYRLSNLVNYSRNRSQIRAEILPILAEIQELTRSLSVHM
jgi:hypothetical protein